MQPGARDAGVIASEISATARWINQELTRAPRVGQAVDVLVVGAGPTGLTLALQAHDHGARVRIVERRAEAFRPSRALIVHPRTLEVLRPPGVTDTLLAGGDPRPRAQLHLGRHVVPVQLAGLDLPDTAFPHLQPGSP